MVSSGKLRIGFAFMNNGMPVELHTLYGANRAAHELSCYFVREGHQVVMFGLGQSDLTHWAGATCASFDSIPEQASAIRNMMPDVLIGVSTAEIFAHVQARKNIVYHHNPTCIDGIGTRGRELYANLQAIVVVSNDAMKRQITYGAPRRKLCVVPNGIDPDVFCADQSVVRSPLRMVCAGTVIDYKGLDIALRAFEAIRQPYPEVELHIYGESKRYSVTADAKSGADWMKSNGLLAQNGFVDWPLVERQYPGVKYFGSVTNEVLANAFRSSSLLISGSLIPETFGLVSIEAQACGCLAVVPDHGGLPETIIPGNTGVTYDAGKVESCTQAILSLLRVQEDDQLEVWRTRAIEHVRRRFSWQKVGKSFDRVIWESPQHGVVNRLAATAWRFRRQCKAVVTQTFLAIAKRTRILNGN